MSENNAALIVAAADMAKTDVSRETSTVGTSGADGTGRARPAQFAKKLRWTDVGARGNGPIEQHVTVGEIEYRVSRSTKDGDGAKGAVWKATAKKDGKTVVLPLPNGDPARNVKHLAAYNAAKDAHHRGGLTVAQWRAAQASDETVAVA